MVPFKISDFLSPLEIIKWRRLLWQTQYYDREKLRSLQWKLISGMLDHAFENVPYYKSVVRKLNLKRHHIRSHDDMHLLPVLEKGVLIDRHIEFKARNFFKYHPQPIYTSGTTGTPLKVYWDRHSNVIELLSIWRHFSWAGYRLGEPFLDIRSVIADKEPGFKWNWQCRGLEISSDIINDDNIGWYANIIRKYRIKLWRGHPHAIASLCQLLKKHRIHDIKPGYVFTVSEALLKNQRSLIEEWTDVPVCDGYGLKEHCALINQCPRGGYHISWEYGYVEIIKEDGTPALPGQEGRIVATGLHNKAFALLRYDTTDYAIASNRRCPCNRTLPLVERVTGRKDDTILNASGQQVSGMHFLFFTLKGIHKAQIVQHKIRSIDVYLVTTDEFDEQTEAKLTDNLRQKLGEDMSIHIHRVEDIPFKSNGKFRFVVNELQKTSP